MTFLCKIRTLASTAKHETLARQLGIKLSLLRSWLYKDVEPNEFAVRALEDKVNRLWKRRK